MIRIIIIPVFTTTIIYKRYNYALYLFAIAAVTDFLDGLLARLTNQKTALGTFLDPLADKFLLVTSFITLSVFGLIPKWLAITVISRDIIVLTGWLILYLSTGMKKVEPSVLGRATIWIQSIFIAFVLVRMNFFLFPEFYLALQWSTAGITILSGLHYIYRELKHIHAI